MTDATWKIQVSPKIGDALVNLRADTGEELAQILSWAEQNATTIASTIQALQAQGNVAAAFPGSQNVQAPPAQEQAPWSGQQQTPAPQQPAQQQAPQQPQAAQQGGFGGPPTKYDLSSPPGPAPQCSHGQMGWRHRTSKAGKEYKGWFCPSQNQGQQCETQWVRG